MTASIMDRNANTAENVDVNQEFEFVDSSAVAGVLMMDPAVNNSWMGKLLTTRTNVKEMTARQT